MKLIETRLSARLRMGDDDDVVGELEAAVASYPHQEGMWELLITALYRAGRQADALAAYQRVRAGLAEDLGLDPGPRLRGLEHRILTQDPSLVAPERALAAHAAWFGQAARSSRTISGSTRDRGCVGSSTGSSPRTRPSSPPAARHAARRPRPGTSRR